MAFLLRPWLPGLHPKTTAKNVHSTKPSRPSQRKRSCLFEALETRALLSATSLANIVATPAVSSSGYTVAQITSAYLANNLSFITSLKGTIAGDGSGQTIAIVDAYNDPNITSDVATFSTKFGLPCRLRPIRRWSARPAPARFPRPVRTGPWRFPWTSNGPTPSRQGEYPAGRGQILQPQ